MAVENSGLRWL